MPKPGLHVSFPRDAPFCEIFSESLMSTTELKMDNPPKIVEYLLDKHGSDEAYNAALAGALEAQAEGDNYRLSVWREVKQLLARANELKA
jgi:hypothetical protein